MSLLPLPLRHDCAQVDGKKKTLFLPGVMANITKGNLEKQLDELFPSGSVLVVTAASLPSTHWEITVNFM